MKKTDDIILCEWTASEVVRAYNRSGENFDAVKEMFRITSKQLKKMLKQAGININSNHCSISMMEDLGLRSQDFLL